MSELIIQITEKINELEDKIFLAKSDLYELRKESSYLLADLTYMSEKYDEGIPPGEYEAFNTSYEQADRQYKESKTSIRFYEG